MRQTLFAALLAIGACEGNLARTNHSQPETPEPSWRLAGEFEPVREVYIGWHETLVPFYEQLIPPLSEQAEVTVIADPASDITDLEAIFELSPATYPMEILRLPIESVWLRDFGPLTVRSREGRQILDMRYFAGGADDDVANLVAREWLQESVSSVDLELEGGNLLADGRGRCLVSTQLLVANADRTEPELRESLGRYFGCSDLDLLPPLADEPTGHVDMFATITGPAEVIIGRFDYAVDLEMVDQTEWAAEFLAERGYLVRRVPMPDQSDGSYRTYTNALAVNGAVFVPIYADHPEGMEEALQVFADAYPDRRIIPIESSDMIHLDGAVHCAALGTPR